jgi:hypothetical protein
MHYQVAIALILAGAGVAGIIAWQILSIGKAAMLRDLEQRGRQGREGGSS